MKTKSCTEETRIGSFHFGDTVRATANPCMNKEIIKELWKGHCYSASELEVTSTDEYVFLIGNVPVPELDGYSYAIEVSVEGIAIAAETEQNLLYGFFALLEYIDPVCLDHGKEHLKIPVLSVKDRPAVNNRMVHFCVFPETDMKFIQKFIRFCGVLKYNYLILEFWGMFRYDCLKELGWNSAFTKEQVRSFVRLANDLGIEVIPMFNHWGHASSGRVALGKHVVLDQNPRRQLLFESNGWVWNIEKPEVRALMKMIRKELIEVCGNGRFFHIGFDEAYGHESLNSDEADLLLDYIREITDDLATYGRRPIMWGDMLLHNRHNTNSQNFYCCNCSTELLEQQLLSKLDKRVVIADWQYNARKYPIETSLFFQKYGFDVLCCPWDESLENIQACAETVTKHALFGIMHTTWHTLQYGAPRGIPCVYYAAVSGWYADAPAFSCVNCALETAALLRKVQFADGNYESAGWTPHQTTAEFL